MSQVGRSVGTDKTLYMAKRPRTRSERALFDDRVHFVEHQELHSFHREIVSPELFTVQYCITSITSGLHPGSTNPSGQGQLDMTCVALPPRAISHFYAIAELNGLRLLVPAALVFIVSHWG